jgi:hypothetical protein
VRARRDSNRTNSRLLASISRGMKSSRGLLKGARKKSRLRRTISRLLSLLFLSKFVDKPTSLTPTWPDELDFALFRILRYYPNVDSVYKLRQSP